MIRFVTLIYKHTPPAMSSEPTSIQQSRFVSEHQWVTVGWSYCCNGALSFMFEREKSYFGLFVNNALTELALFLCTVCLENKEADSFHAVTSETHKRIVRKVYIILSNSC
jgi:hypothetical protein